MVRSRWPGASTWTALGVAFVIAVTLGSMLWLLQSSLRTVESRDRSTQMKLVSAALTTAFDQAGRFALAIAETTARRDAVAAALAARDRVSLQRLSQAAFDYLRLQSGVQIYGYHDKDLRYLLRMHRPETFDDDISAFRSMVVAANRSARAQTGIEIGIAGIGVRGIAVVNQGQDMVGTMEVGLDLKPILELVKATNNADIAVIIVPSMSGVALDDKMPRFGDLALAMSTDDSLFASLLSGGRVRPTRDVDVAEQRIDGRAYDMVTQPLVDFSGRLIGMTIALKDNPHLDARRIGKELWVMALCGAILSFVAFAVLFRAATSRGR
jgi:hypothetical protein